MAAKSARKGFERDSAVVLETTPPEASRSSHELGIHTGIVARFLFPMALILGFVDILLQTIDLTLSPAIPGWVQVVKLFDLDREFAFPTWYSIMLLFSSALLLGLIAWSARRTGDAKWRYWAALGLIFTMLSIDEQVLAHESIGQLIGDRLATDGIFFYAWVIPGTMVTFALGLAFIPFLRSLRRRTALGMLVAAAIYLGGALGMEMISGVVAGREGVDNLLYATITSIEEIFEILGISLFLLVLLSEARRRLPRVSLSIDPPAAS